MPYYTCWKFRYYGGLMNKLEKNISKKINANNNGPTIRELKLLLNRIEELDAKRVSNLKRSKKSEQQAA